MSSTASNSDSVSPVPPPVQTAVEVEDPTELDANEHNRASAPPSDLIKRTPNALNLLGMPESERAALVCESFH
jgi:hypothetical protein